MPLFRILNFKFFPDFDRDFANHVDRPKMKTINFFKKFDKTT